MKFASDNCSGATPEIIRSLEKHACGVDDAYGDGSLDKKVEEKFCDIFETDVSVLFVGTGTAANSLAIAATTKPGGVVFSHDEAHIIVSEGGAPEFFSGGGRLCPVGGKDGKIDPGQLETLIANYPPGFNHLGQATMVSITQATETGSVYSCEEISRISNVAKTNNLPLHLDGARFANALVHLDVSPAEMTWKQGVDLVSFGGTKNGCWCAEALIVFNRDLKEHIEFIRKRAGHLFSKTRFISAQFEAYLEDDLWLRLARHSNGVGERLMQVVKNSNRVRSAWESQSNQVFFIAQKQLAENMHQQGATFFECPTPNALKGQIAEDECLYRLVASFSSTQKDVDDIAKMLG